MPRDVEKVLLGRKRQKTAAQSDELALDPRRQTQEKEK
jgi:hypothetical protein